MHFQYKAAGIYAKLPMKTCKPTMISSSCNCWILQNVLITPMKLAGGKCLRYFVSTIGVLAYPIILNIFYRWNVDGSTLAWWVRANHCGALQDYLSGRTWFHAVRKVNTTIIYVFINDIPVVWWLKLLQIYKSFLRLIQHSPRYRMTFRAEFSVDKYM